MQNASTTQLGTAYVLFFDWEEIRLIKNNSIKLII